MSSDFDKSDADEGIDFYEAERLSVEHFETTYPEFIAYLNRMVREAIIRGEWFCQVQASSGWPRGKPWGRDAANYLLKKGFDISSNSNHAVSFTWNRRDRGKYP